MNDTLSTVARVARTSHARLLALLAARTRDVAAAEDALSEAFASALTHWPARGVPDNPEAWLLTAARRQLIDAARHQAVQAAALPGLLALCDELLEQDHGVPFPDERLRLLFACAHPALEPGVRTALMLQCVLGLDVARIAGAFLTTPATLAQRLVRAKRKIAEAGVPSNCRLPISGRNGSMPCSPRWKSPIRRRMRTQPVPARMLVSPRRCWN